MNMRTWANQIVKNSPKLPLRLVLAGPFVLQICAAVGITGYISLRNGQQAINDLVSQLRGEVTARIYQHIDTFLAQPHLINQLNTDAIRFGQLKTQDFSSKQYLWQQIQAFNTVRWIYFATEQNNESLGVTQRGNPNSLQIAISDQSTGFQTYFYGMDNQGKKTNLLEIKPVIFNPKTRPWYKAAVKAGKPTWSEIYPDIDTGQLTITASNPVYDQVGKLRGVSAVDLFLKDINTFLTSLKIGKSGQAFIIERSGLLIANSQANPSLISLNKDKEPKRLKATESSDLLLQSTANYLTNKFQDLNKITRATQLDFSQNGKRKFVQITPYQDNRGLDWLIVVVVPEADFMEQINTSTRITILLCIVAAILAILVGLLTAYWITKPIVRLNQASVAMSKGELDQKVAVEGISELSDMAQSFNKMAKQIRESFINLENTNKELEVLINQYKQAQVQLLQSEKMSTLGYLVAGVAHEINNPIGCIAGNLTHTEQYIQDIVNLLNLYQEYYPNPVEEIQEQIETIELDYLQEDLPNIITSMKEGTERICNISTSLRTFSRIDSQSKVFVDLHEGIDTTLMILKYRLKANDKRPEIEVIKEYGLLPLVECYSGQLNQVFMNIIANAIDAFDEANQHRTLEEILLAPNRLKIITTVNKNTNTVKIRIKDNGPGIPDAIKKQIYDNFFTTKPIGKGTGLGLSISRQIVIEKHNGSLTCISLPEPGTEFIIEIPIRQKAVFKTF